MTDQLTLDIWQTQPCSKPCIWLEEWHGYQFCYLWQTFRVKCLGYYDGR